MFQYYFLYEDQLPTEVGFRLFGLIHMSWLVAIGLFIFLATRVYQKADERNQNKYEKIMTVMMVMLDLYKDAVLIITGNFHVWELPLDMCTMAIYISCFHAFTHSKITWEILYCISMPGALAALLFPNWNGYPQINFININSFLTHALIVTYSMMLLLSGRFRPNIRHYIGVWIFLAVAVTVVALVNQKYDTNFLFLSVPSRDSPLVTIYNFTGEKLYLLGYAVAVLTVNLIMYVPFIISDRRKKVVIHR
jgi:hypothetical integral membrane protein (TIGR02206 family)